jgi:hypothetical protein
MVLSNNSCHWWTVLSNDGHHWWMALHDNGCYQSMVTVFHVKQDIINSDCDLFLIEGYHRMELVWYRGWTEVPMKFFCKGNLQEVQMEEIKQLHNFIETNR